jgi:hypothetical protein
MTQNGCKGSALVVSANGSADAPARRSVPSRSVDDEIAGFWFMVIRAPQGMRQSRIDRRWRWKRRRS